VKVGDLVTHWVSKRIGVIVEISEMPSYKVQWFNQSKPIRAFDCEMSGWYDEMRLDAVKKCP